MTIPSNTEILTQLARLDTETADDLETQWLEFKPWTSPKDDMRVAIEYVVCFANAEGGVIVFGVADRTRGRAAAIHGAGNCDLDVWRRGIFDSTRPKLVVEVEELTVPEGTGRLILVRVPKGAKRIPYYEDRQTQVTLRVFNGSFDERMAKMVAQWRGTVREVDLDVLLLLTYLREHAFIDTAAAANLLQTSVDDVRSILDQKADPRTGILERKGKTRAATFHLTKAVARDLLGKASYTRLKGIDPIRYREMVREYAAQHGSINSEEARELLGTGESTTAKVEISRLLRDWSMPGGFLRKEGTRGPNVRYFPVDGGSQPAT
jgi:predicted HTH transcriptional regulator